jgi:hypothetical protein
MKIRLDDIEKTPPFEAPEGYFNDLPDRIMDRIKSEEKPKQTFLQPWMKYAVAASVAILAVVLMVLNSPSEDASPETLLAEVSDEAILDYLADSGVTTDDILEVSSFDEADVEFIQEETMPELDIETLDAIIEDIELIEQDLNTL